MRAKNQRAVHLMSHLVSVLIPAYNAQKWISDTIESVLAQTWPETEIIVVDDGSTDQTLAVARSFAAKNVNVLATSNQGAAAARNRAFAASQGEYVQWLDADDLLAPDKIEIQMNVVERCQSRRTLFSSAWGRFINRTRKAAFTPTSLWCDLSPVDWLMRKMGENIFMQPATWLVSRELTEAAGPWDSRLLSDDDGEYFCRVLLASDGVRFVPEAKVLYRTGINSLSHIGLSKKKLESQVLTLQLHVRHLRQMEDSPRVHAVCLKYLGYSLPYFYPGSPDLVRLVEEIAASVHGSLQKPRLSWKYALLQRLFGWVFAKRVQLYYNQCKLFVRISWDRLLFRLEGRMTKTNDLAKRERKHG
jgi:glycosyltransferase involved in cell wall biosynthesis